MTWGCSEQGGLRGDHINPCKCPKGKNQMDRTRGNGQTPQDGKFHTNTRKIFIAERVTEHWHRMHTEALDFLSSKILKAHLDVFLCDCCREQL